MFDRGHADYDWFQQLTEDGVHFVTRLKNKARYLVVERCPRPEKSVRSDEIIVFEQQARSETGPFLAASALLG